MSLELSGTTPAIKGVAGSVSAPAITGDDVDTGISFPSANTIKFSTGGVERMSITDSGITGVSGGKILQHVYVEKTDITSQINESARTDISGMSATITPSATSSKILILCDLNIGMPSGGYHINLHLMRGSTDIAEGTGASGSGFSNAVNATASTYNFGGFGNEPIHTSALDSPNTTSATTYKWQWHVPNYNNQTIYLNRNHSQQDYAYNTWKSSRIILFEVGA